MSLSKEEKRNLFCYESFESVKKFLKDNPAWDVNEDFDAGWTALHLVCFYGHYATLSVLLAHPQTNVNQKNVAGYPPFSVACSSGQVEAAKVLLRDSRVDINMPDIRGWTPLWSESCHGRVEVIKWMIASGREINLDRKGKYLDGKEYTAIEIARRETEPAVVSLLEKFATNPLQTRYEIRLELGVTEALAAELFATTVFLCDDYLRIKQPESNSKIGRFFRITSHLPMELQMIVCHRVYGLAKENIPSRDSELAFKNLASSYGK